jgi:hypothetical protein
MMLSLWFGYSLRKMKAVIIELAHWNFAGRSEQHPFGPLIFNVDLIIS